MLVPSCGVSSDSSIEKMFDGHQPEFEELRAMVSKESSITSFARNYILRSGGYFLFKDRDPTEQELGMTKERWSQYVRLMNVLGIAGVLKGGAGEGVSFKVDVESMFNGGRTKGITYSSVPLKPLVSNLDGYKPSPDVLDDHGGFVVYKQLKPHWYLYLAR